MASNSHEDELWERLDETGEDQVRKNLAADRYGKDEPLVQAWLEQKDEELAGVRAERRNDRADEELTVVRSAKNAAWVSAIAAAVSVIISVIALIVAL